LRRKIEHLQPFCVDSGGFALGKAWVYVLF
jgi:hypothetical protein